MDTNERVRQFIISNFYVADPADLRDQDSLLEAGVMDSTGVLEVVSFLESQFSLSIQDAEIVPENLDSIARIAAFIQRKTALSPLTTAVLAAAMG